MLISGNSPFCETFFDNVEVPKDQIVGELNRGWDVAKYLLGHEREMISGGGRRRSHCRRSARRSARRTGVDDPLLRAELAQFDVDALAFTRRWARSSSTRSRSGKGHPAQPNMMKYAGTELNKRRHELVMAAGGSRRARMGQREHPAAAPRPRTWLRTKANSIEGGTSEVMLNVIAKRILELPGRLSSKLSVAPGLGRGSAA